MQRSLLCALDQGPPQAGSWSDAEGAHPPRCVQLGPQWRTWEGAFHLRTDKGLCGLRLGLFSEPDARQEPLLSL